MGGEVFSKNVQTLVLAVIVVFVTYHLNIDKFAESSIKALVHLSIQSVFILAIYSLLQNKQILRVIFSLFLMMSFFSKMTYGSFLSVGIVMSVLTTSFSEAVDFFEHNYIEVILASLCTIGLFCLHAAQIKLVKLGGVAVGAFYLLAPSIMGYSKIIESDGYQHHMLKGTARGLSNTASSVEYFFVNELGYRFPALTGIKGFSDTALFYLAQSDTSSSWSDVKVSDDSPSTLILVIGESLRADHMGIYGYERDTTPKLNADQTLNVYKNAYSGGTVILPFLTEAKSRSYAAINGGLPPLALCGLS
jgi:glucan phosphoethanolaminetransferase (alkaline phosphatase superfamily)